MTQIPKDILFYSNFCEYSKEVLGIIAKKNIRNDFVLVCVDNRTSNLPSFVDRVPLIFSITTEVIVDEGIQKYIDTKYSSNNGDLEPFSLFSASGKSNYSDAFSFIEEGGQEDFVKGYTYLNMNDGAISTVQEESDSTKKSKIDSSILEKFMAERDNDLKNIKNSLQTSL
jgi:hypothetical protein